MIFVFTHCYWSKAFLCKLKGNFVPTISVESFWARITETHGINHPKIQNPPSLREKLYSFENNHVCNHNLKQSSMKHGRFHPKFITWYECQIFLEVSHSKLNIQQPPQIWNHMVKQFKETSQEFTEIQIKQKIILYTGL